VFYPVHCLPYLTKIFLDTKELNLSHKGCNVMTFNAIYNESDDNGIIVKSQNLVCPMDFLAKIELVGSVLKNQSRHKVVPK
jgi:uncharacterized protein YbcV (DUF1398 family)